MPSDSTRRAGRPRGSKFSTTGFCAKDGHRKGRGAGLPLADAVDAAMAARRDKRLEEGPGEDDDEDGARCEWCLLRFGCGLGCCEQDEVPGEQPARPVCIGLAIMEQGATRGWEF